MSFRRACRWPVGPWLLALLVALGAFGVVGGAAWGSADKDEFSTSVHEGRSGAMAMSIGSGSGSIGVASHDITAGDTIQRLISLSVDKGSGVTKVQLQLFDEVARPTVLSTDAINGLHVIIEGCSGAANTGWIRTGAPESYKYACPKGHEQSTVLPSTSLHELIVRGMVTIPHLRHTGFTHLRVTLSLPSTAGDAFQRKTAQVRFVFSGVLEGPRSG